MFDFLKKEKTIAPPQYNRWKVTIASILIHLCIGSVYAWSIFNPALTKMLGIVAPAADDWTLSQVVWIFSVAIVFLGLAASVAGKWLERVGPRMVGITAATLWGGGFLVGYLGIETHQLWLLYLGYGVIGGCGLGLGYVSPVSTLIRWFPDHRGLATGLAIMGFGGGAMIGGPLKRWLLSIYQSPAQSLGDVANLNIETVNGVRFAHIADQLKEVVISSEQAFLVGTGNTGIGATFLTLAVGYFTVMVIAAMMYKIPAEGWRPRNFTPPKAQNSMITKNHVSVDNAMKTPQFYLLWIVLCMNVSAGIGVIGIAKTMITEIFQGAMPLVVNGAFASFYVVMISVFNMTGRFIWASTSDYIGRKNTYYIFFVLGIALYMSIPYAAQSVSVNPAVKYLVMFYGATVIIFTMYGGGFATIPAYLADIFGTRNVGAIHGRLLTAWSTAGVVGPLAITKLRAISIDNAIFDLVDKVDDIDFVGKFGAGKETLARLIETKTVTISNLMEIAPVGTVDPSATIYNTTMYTMAGLLVVGLVANYLVKPVNKKHHS